MLKMTKRLKKPFLSIKNGKCNLHAAQQNLYTLVISVVQNFNFFYTGLNPLKQEVHT